MKMVADTIAAIRDTETTFATRMQPHSRRVELTLQLSKKKSS